MEWKEELEALGFCVEPCGSRVTCNPPPTDTDQDYLVSIVDEYSTHGEIEKVISEADELLASLEFVLEGSDHYQVMISSHFASYRKGDVNLIVSSNLEFSRRHRSATKLCTRLNLMDKEDRKALFQAVLYGN